MMRLQLLLLVVLVSLTVAAQPVPDYSKIAPHPRLILRQGDVEAMREMVENDAPLRALHCLFEERTNEYINAEPCTRVKTGKRLLSVSREVLRRVCHCAYMYLIDGDELYARRAEREMLVAASFADWNPSHFLDVAELMAALAIGYDWLYDYLSPASRRTIEDAIIEKGLRTARPTMEWYRQDNNRTQVCNAGMIMGALAVYERIPEEAQGYIESSLRGNARALGVYAPDGVYPEGYGYWIYGNWYEVMLLESLRTALGTSFDIEQAPGLRQTGLFANFMITPIVRTFNFYDCDNQYNEINPLLYWFALEAGDMSLVWQDRKRLMEEENVRGITGHAPLAMIFASRCNRADVQPIKQRFWAGQGVTPLFIYRSGFASEDDSYLAAKGGSPLDHHAHMDGGSFIYEWGGVRWARDLGMQDYHSLESKGVRLGHLAGRWAVYRLNNYSHNTLTINDTLHKVNGRATMTKVYDKHGCHGAEFDLTTLFPQMSSVERTLCIDDEARVVCVDRLASGDEPCSVRWNMCTFAKAEILSDSTIRLTERGRELVVRVTAPQGVKAYIASNNTDTSYDAKNDGVRVGFELKMAPHSKCTLIVALEPRK